MTPDEERWAEALPVLKLYGACAEAFIARRIEALGTDPEGQARWRLIADRLRQVREAAGRERGLGDAVDFAGECQNAVQESAEILEIYVTERRPLTGVMLRCRVRGMMRASPCSQALQDEDDSMDEQPSEASVSSADSETTVDIIAASIHEQFGLLGQAVVQSQLEGADGSALVNWQAIGRRLAVLQGRRE